MNTLRIAPLINKITPYVKLIAIDLVGVDDKHNKINIVLYVKKYTYLTYL